MSPRMHSNVLIPRKVKDINFKIKSIAAGDSHTLILSKSGDVYVLGSNSSG
jgi:alpha-tubulin suppressor-like RCC1 family protein